MYLCNWPLRRIMEFFPDKENKIRVVGVKTGKVIFKRFITENIFITIEKLSTTLCILFM